MSNEITIRGDIALEKFCAGNFCTIVGNGVPMPEGDGIVRIGSGGVYLEIQPTGEAKIVGAQSADEAVNAVLAGVQKAISLNPYYRRGA